MQNFLELEFCRTFYRNLASLHWVKNIALRFLLNRLTLCVEIHWVLLSVFQTAIANATTLAEVERLKGMLQAGQIPGRERKTGHFNYCFPNRIYLFLFFPDVLCELWRELRWKGQTVQRTV